MVIDPRRAWSLIEPYLEPLAATPVERRRALGRVLAEPLAATVDVPAADVSAMDGYALAGEPAAGEERPVAGVVAAGDPPGAACPAGAALRIMTGAPVPAGADRVVPVELTDGGRQRVRFDRGTAAGAHIRRRAEVVAAGEPLLPAGAPLTPGALALLAAHGHHRVAVHRAPRVAVLATGDEVVPADREPGPGQLRDTHTDFLLAAGATLGLAFEPLGIAPDDAGELGKRVAAGLSADVLLLCGGVSMGEFDLVEGVLEGLGCRRLFDAVAVQPGKPLVAAVHDGGLVFGLPGNPGSVMVSFWLFVRPALRRLLGYRDGFLAGLLAGTLAAPAPGAKARDRYLPATVEARDGRLLVTPHPPRGSHDLAATAHGGALLRIPAGAAPAVEGDPCEVLPIG